MDRAFFGDEPLTGFITICCFLVFNFVFYFLQRYDIKAALLCAVGAILLQICHRLLAPLRQICYGGKRVLAILWQIFHTVSRLMAALWQIPQRVLATFANSTYLPEGCHSSLILGQRVWITLHFRGYWITSMDIFKRVAPLTKKEATFLQYLWRN